MDQYNQALLDNARPSSWQNPTPSGKYNLVVIGSGTAGLVSAIGAAGMGGKVALIEKRMMGGDCLNAGCVPSKSIIRSAKAIGEIRKADTMGIHVPEGVHVDFGGVMERMRRIRANISHDDSVQRVTNAGVELYFGAGRFTGPNTIEVVNGDQRQTLEFAKAVVATGSRPRPLPTPGAEEVGYLTNETLFELTEQPRRLAVIGSGPIGAEMAQTFARLGTEVTIIEIDSQILIREDQDAARIVQDSLVKDGIQLILNAKIQSMYKSDTGKVIVYEQNEERKTIEVDDLLVSIGRIPNVEGLNLEAAGVEYSNRGVTVDGTMRTSNPNVYAAGDIGIRYQFTHVADATARIVLQNALFPGPKKKADDLIVPWTTYTDPEIAHVGMYEHEAKAKGIAVKTFVQQLDTVDRAKADGETEGFVKIHVKEGTDKILGATIVASHAGEMISEITTAMVAGVGLQTIATVIHPYPTQTEAIKKIADQYNRTRLTPLVKRIFSTWLSWQR
ncbi:dihydrolipoyl dehydrogenase [bacterium]|nr:dihydrolipoyl dehydrogenase [bacterium]